MGALTHQNYLTSATNVKFSSSRVRGYSGAILQLRKQAVDKNGTRTTGPNVVQRSNTQYERYCS